LNIIIANGLAVIGRGSDLPLLAFLFFGFTFFSFSYLFAAVIGLLLGLLSVQAFWRKHHRDGKFLPRSSQV